MSAISRSTPDDLRRSVQWHESVEGSPEDAPLDESQASVVAEAARLEALVERDRESWTRIYELGGASTVASDEEEVAA